jgi:hypothetical protein
LFRKITAKSELRKQKQIWRVFGVNYEAEKKKQEEIWRSLPQTEKKVANHHRVMIPVNKKNEYFALKQAIYEHLRHRPDFQKGVDATLIEQAARLYADWLYVEEIMSLCQKDDIRKYSMALQQIHDMLLNTFNVLNIAPNMRKKIANDLQNNDEISEKLKKLIGAK